MGEARFAERKLALAAGVNAHGEIYKALRRRQCLKCGVLKQRDAALYVTGLAAV